MSMTLYSINQLVIESVVRALQPARRSWQPALARPGSDLYPLLTVLDLSPMTVRSDE